MENENHPYLIPSPNPKVINIQSYRFFSTYTQTFLKTKMVSCVQHSAMTFTCFLKMLRFIHSTKMIEHWH